jgi:hypothetical protein
VHVRAAAGTRAWVWVCTDGHPFYVLHAAWQSHLCTNGPNKSGLGFDSNSLQPSTPTTGSSPVFVPSTSKRSPPTCCKAQRATPGEAVFCPFSLVLLFTLLIVRDTYDIVYDSSLSQHSRTLDHGNAVDDRSKWRRPGKHECCCK